MTVENSVIMAEQANVESLAKEKLKAELKATRETPSNERNS
jgi:hypothetical protein